MQSTAAVSTSEPTVQAPSAKRARRPILLVPRTEAEVQLKSKSPSWSVSAAEGSDALIRKYQFRRYKDAAKFVQNVVEIVQELKHHPVITLTFHQVDVTTYTHEGYTPGDNGEEVPGPGISARDFSLAARVEEAYHDLMSSLQAQEDVSATRIPSMP
ncbi:hypothetical protein FRB95_007288 [Tulasnella sp. JGI-2019a]|nr:hypothetical protein FRB93_011154 [Tulasnella sp. JGI-2019a]KAG9036993.1 hypothetical protein FRB95_007288 [Tulasnella sp. JGI-2019a]